MIVAQTKTQALRYNLFPRSRDCKTRVVYVHSPVALVHQSASQRRAASRFHLNRKFTTTRAGRDGRAERIKEAFRCCTVSRTYHCLVSRERLLQLNHVRAAVVLRQTIVEEVSAARYLALASRISKTKSAVMRQPLLCVEPADVIRAGLFLSLHHACES